MASRTSTPDVGSLEIPVDAWTAPFWEATADERIILPHCTDCGDYRWPPGPFCPACHAQEVAWTESGAGRIYSYTIVRRPADVEGGEPRILAPALIEFPEAGGVRLIAAIVDTPVTDIAVGAVVRTGFSQAANGKVPVFRVAAEQTT